MKGSRFLSAVLAAVVALTPAGGVYALDTTATTGFDQIAQMAGPPTGVPSGAAAKAWVVWDSTNKELRFYTGGAWQRVFGQDLKTTASPTFATVNATNLAGTLTTAAQPNVTSLGTLTSLATGTITLSDATNLVFNTGTGTKIGTGTTQKFAFWNATPVAQIAGSTDVLAGLVTLGLRAASSNPPLNLGSGALTAGASTLGATTVTTLGMGGTLTVGANTLSLASSTVSGTPTWSSSQAITLSTAAQPNITSLGTLTSLATGTITLSSNTILSNLGTGILGLSDSTTGTDFRVYNTTDSTSSPTNSEYVGVSWSANVATLKPVKTGTGTLRNFVVQHGDGSSGTPSIGFVNNTDRGIYNDTTNTGIGFSVGGSGRFLVAATLAWCQSGVNFQCDAQIRAGAGTTTPSVSFSANTDRGICNDTTNSGVGIVVGGTQRAVFTATTLQTTSGIHIDCGGSFRSADGTVALPGVSFTGHTAYGMFYDSGNSGLGFSVNNSEKLFVGPTLVWVTGSNAFQCDGATTLGTASVTFKGTGGGNAQTMVINTASELLTLSTGGTTTNSVANLLPANSLILSVTTRVTTTITTATSWSVGDSTTATRFSSANSTMTAGTTMVGINHANGGVVAGAGIMQTAAATVRITTVGTPGAGAVRITVHFITLTAATS